MKRYLTINKLFIADNHELVLLGLVSLLEKAFNITITTALSNTKDIMEALDKPNYDLYIIDIEFIDTSGFELIKRIRKIQKNAKIIVYTVHEEIWTVKELLNLEINGLVQKRSSSQYLVTAVEEVMHDKKFFCPRFSEIKRRDNKYRKNIPSKTALFTPTEQKVANLIAKGYATKEIASILSVSDSTIETHRRNLFIKLDVKNVAHFVSITITNRLVDIE